MRTSNYSETIKMTSTEELVKQRREWKAEMDILEMMENWSEVSRIHETYIAPINEELEKRGIW